MRSACSPPTGCHRCGSRLSGRRTAYCSDGCRTEHYQNHQWNSARYAAEERVRKSGIAPYMRRTWRCEGPGPHRGMPEVHHKVPLTDAREYGEFTCKHHQEGLMVLCKDCHLRAHGLRLKKRGVPLAQQAFALMPDA